MATSANPTFKAILLDNAASGEDLTWLTTSSCMVFSVVSGTVDISDESDSGSFVLWQGTSAGPLDSARIILDYYQGARLKATATSAGTTVTVAKHTYQDM